MIRRGFTLVELLVVIAIIGVLVSLLLPAVQSARSAALNLQCQNNIRNLGLGMITHQSQHGFFPGGGWGWNWTGDPDRGTGQEQPAGWNYPLLPFIEQNAVYHLGLDGQPDLVTQQQMDGALRRDQTPIPLFVCPARRSARLYPRPRGMTYKNGRRVTEAGPIDYAANAGSRSPTWYGGPRMFEDAMSGAFNWNSNQVLDSTGISFARSEVKPAQIRDGLSNTYLLGEKYLQPEKYTDGWDSADDFGMYEGCAHDTYRWCDFYDPNNNRGRTPLQDRRGLTEHSAFGSAHSSGCNFVFGDGSVRSISYSIDPATHSYLGDRADNQPVNASQD